MKGLLANIDPLDVDEFVMSIEKSYQINFIDSEVKIETFGDFVTYVLEKLKLKNFVNKKECTSQHIFYNLRKIIAVNNIFPAQKLSPKTKLSDIFKIIERRKQIRLLEKDLGFKIDALRPTNLHVFLILLSVIFTIISLFLNFFSIQTLILFLVLLLLILSSNPLSIIFKDKTFGELIKRIERENYITSQKRPVEISEFEVEKNLTEMFKEFFDFKEIKITRETRL